MLSKDDFNLKHTAAYAINMKYNFVSKLTDYNAIEILERFIRLGNSEVIDNILYKIINNRLYMYDNRSKKLNIIL